MQESFNFNFLWIKANKIKLSIFQKKFKKTILYFHILTIYSDYTHKAEENMQMPEFCLRMRLDIMDSFKQKTLLKLNQTIQVFVSLTS